MASITEVPAEHRSEAERIHPATAEAMTQPELDGRAAALAALTEKAARCPAGDGHKAIVTKHSRLRKSCAPSVLAARLAELDERHDRLLKAPGMSAERREAMTANLRARADLVKRNPQAEPAALVVKAPLTGPTGDVLNKAYVIGQAVEKQEKLMSLSQALTRAQKRTAAERDAERQAAEFTRIAETVSDRELAAYYRRKARQVAAESAA